MPKFPMKLVNKNLEAKLNYSYDFSIILGVVGCVFGTCILYFSGDLFR